jgi:hypothetical protein
LDIFDFEAVMVISKAQVMALAADDVWLNNGANLLLFGPPGGARSCHDGERAERGAITLGGGRSAQGESSHGAPSQRRAHPARSPPL